MQALICIVWVASSVQGQEWARKMFNRTTHEFGTMARGSKAVHAFQVKNLYEETVHIAGVRSSCGCTIPQVVNPTIKTFETAEIIAEFNTVAFRGHHSATVTVTIDQPYYAEVQLHVAGNVRSDVVIHPGAVQFGSVNHGAGGIQKVSVLYAGRDDWQIVDVRSAKSLFEVDVQETQRNAGRVSYDLAVELKDSAPVGYFNEQLVLVTNDPRTGRIPLHVEGRVTPEITVSPTALVLGEVPVGKTVTKKLVIKSNTKQPFKILEVRCDDQSFSFESAEGPKPLHLVSVAFSPREKTGEVRETIRIQTDRGDEEVTLVAHATVVADQEEGRGVDGTP
jgi:hypothetical protein